MLRMTGGEMPLDPAAVVASVYERGAYARKLDYRQPPPSPPLSAEEAVWWRRYWASAS
jgi:hypothetical protein